MKELEYAAKAIANADALLITAGAGMGVDSGLATFRGKEGWWTDSVYEPLGIELHKLMEPEIFREDPELAWGFYGQRRNEYRAAVPHQGYRVLAQWAASRDTHVFTSNVDGAFVKAGFRPDIVVECHGSIEHEQCLNICGVGIYYAARPDPAIDEATLRMANPPACPQCGRTSRPNVMMFGDPYFDRRRTDAQINRMRSWRRRVKGRNCVVVEVGAGADLPTVRERSEFVAGMLDAPLIRINPDYPNILECDGVGVAMGALEALTAIDALI